MSSTADNQEDSPGGDLKQDIKIETVSKTNLNQLTNHEYCRFCANLFPKPDLHYFSESEEESNKLLCIIHLMKIDIEPGDDLPQTTCEQCIQTLEGVEKIYKIIINAQVKLQSIFKREAPIKVETESTKAISQIREGFNFSVSDSENEQCREDDDEHTEESANILEEKKEETVLLISDSDSEHDTKLNINKTQNRNDEQKNNTDKTNDTKFKLLTGQRKQLIQKAPSNRSANKIRNNPNVEHKNKHNINITNDTKLKLLAEQKKQLIQKAMRRAASNIIIGSTTIKPMQRKKEAITRPKNQSMRENRKDFHNSPVRTDDLTLRCWSEFLCCMRCDHKAQSFQDLRQHSWSTHKSCIKFKCVECSIPVVNYIRFLKHMTKKHYANLERCCPFCCEYFDSIPKLALHIKFEHCDEQKPHMCNTCGTTFDEPEELKKHRESFLILSRKENDGITYACSKCKRVFLNKVSLEWHLNQHDLINVCTVCNKQYKSKYLLNYHVKNMHSDSIRLWYCEMCGKGFKHKTKLNEHISRHTKEFRHSCKLCEKMFASSTALKEHQVTHSGARPYACKMCEQSYRYKSGLNLHVAKKHPVTNS